MPVTIKIPEDKEAYSLFINGRVIGKYTEMGLGTLLRIQGTAVAFYSYSKHRRAYIFCECSEPDLETPALEGNIPLVKQKVRVLYEARGRKIDLLKFLCWRLEKKYGDEVYTWGVRYWIRISSIIDSSVQKAGKKSPASRVAECFTERYIKERRRLGEDIKKHI